MRHRFTTRAARLLLTLLPAAIACTPSPRPATAPLPSPVEAPVPVPALPVAVPAMAARSGIVYRLGLKSDLTEFSTGSAGTLWVVAAGERAELLQGPIVFRSGGPAGTAASFQVQAGAFSQEEPARRLAERLATAFSTTGEVAFSADRGLYRVLLGGFSARPEADALLEKLKAQGQDGFVVPGAPRAAGSSSGTIAVSGATGAPLEMASPVDVFGPAPDVRVSVDGVAYRGSLRVLVNPRGTLNVVNRIDLEEYLWGVVPAEMGPKRFDAIEALKAQAVAARTYAMAHRGQFEAEGYDICPGPKCQAYGGAAVEDPLSTAAVDGTRGLVLAFQGQFADALYVSTCGGVTENVENVFSGGPVPYLVSVECGELPAEDIAGAAVPRDGGAAGRTSLEWRGYVLRRLSPKKAAVRAAGLETAQKLAGVPRHGAPPARLTPAAVYPSLVTAFDLTEARALQLTRRDEAYFDEPPSAARGLSGAPRGAYEFLLRFRFAGDSLPPADRELTRGGVRRAGVLDRASHAGRHRGERPVSVARGLEPLGQGAGRPHRTPGRSGGAVRPPDRRRVPPDGYAAPSPGRPGALVQGRRTTPGVLGGARPGRADLRAGIGLDGVGAPRARAGAREAHGRPGRRKRGARDHRSRNAARPGGRSRCGSRPTSPKRLFASSS